MEDINKKIGLLDFGYFNPDHNNSIELINFTLNFVQKLEDYNFSRYWMAEHYNDFCSWTNPEILITVLAGMTEKISIGAAGILVYFHSPFRVSSSFKMISSLFPERIDLGLARGNVNSHMKEHLTGSANLDPNIYKENERKILDYLRNHQLYDEQDRMVPIPPYGGGIPALWSLGSSLSSATHSININTNYSLSLIHDKNQSIQDFRDTWLTYVGKKNELNKTYLQGNIAVQYTAISDLQELKKFSEENKISFNDKNSLKIIGEPSFCEDKIESYFELFGCDEIIIQDLSRNLKHRLETVESASKILSNPIQ